MTMAAQLMAAGADQQLIAAKLQESHEIDSLPVSTISENEKSEKPAVTEAPIEAESEQSTLPPDSIAISHGEEKAVETALPKQPKSQPEPTNYPTSTLPPTVVPEKISKPSPPEAIVPEQKPETIAAEAVAPPLLGGILNATTDLAAEDNRRELENQQNKTILSHSYLGGAEPDHNTLINSAIQTNDTQSVDIFSGGPLASLPPTINLPLPPSLPDFSTLPPPPLPDFKAVTPEPISSVSSEPATNDPSQFKIPG